MYREVDCDLLFFHQCHNKITSLPFRTTSAFHQSRLRLDLFPIFRCADLPREKRMMCLFDMVEKNLIILCTSASMLDPGILFHFVNDLILICRHMCPAANTMGNNWTGNLGLKDHGPYVQHWQFEGLRNGKLKYPIAISLPLSLPRSLSLSLSLFIFL